MSNESLRLLSFDLDSCVIHISKQVAGSCSCEVVQSPLLHLLHVDVGHNGGHCRTHGTAIFLFVKNVIAFEVRHQKAKVQKVANLVRVEISSDV